MSRSRELTQLPSTLAKRNNVVLPDRRVLWAIKRQMQYGSMFPMFVFLLFFFFSASACTATVRFHLVSTVGGLPLPSVKPKNCCVDLKMSRTLRSHGGGTRSARGPKFILGLGFNFDHSLPENRPWKSPPVPLLLLAVLNCKGSDS